MTGPNLNLSVTAASAVASFEALTGAAKGLAEALLAVKTAGAGGISVTQTIRQEAGAASQEVATALGRIEALLQTHTARMETMEKESLVKRRASKKTALAQDVKDNEEALAIQVTAGQLAQAQMLRAPLAGLVKGTALTPVQAAIGGTFENATFLAGENQMLRAYEADLVAYHAKEAKKTVDLTAQTELRRGLNASGENQMIRGYELDLVAYHTEQAAKTAELAKQVEAQVALNAWGENQMLRAYEADLVVYRAVQAKKAAAALEGGAAATASSGGYARSATRGVAGAAGLNMLTYGASIPAVVGGFAVAAALGETIKLGATFQEQMAFVRIASSDTAETIKTVSDQILEMGGKTIYTPVEMAKGMRTLAQAGYSTADSFKALTPVMNLATLGEVTVGAAAETTQAILHAFGLQVSDATRVTDVVSKSANISATNVGAMSEALKQASTVAQQYGISIEMMGALLAQLAQRGIQGSAAGSAITRMLVNLDPVSRSGQKALEALKISAYDTTGAMKPMLVVLKEAADAFARFTPQSQNMLAITLEGFRGQKGLLSSIAGINTGDLQNYYKQNLGAAGYGQQSVDIVSETTAKKWETFKGALDTAFIKAFNDVGSGANDILKKLTDTVTDPKFVEGLVGLSKAFLGLAVGAADTVKILVGTVASINGLIRDLDAGINSIKPFRGLGGAIGDFLYGTFGIEEFTKRNKAILDQIREIVAAAGGVDASPGGRLLKLATDLAAAVKQKAAANAFVSPASPTNGGPSLMFANRNSAEAAATAEGIALTAALEAGRGKGIVSGTDTFKKVDTAAEHLKKANEGAIIATARIKLAAAEQEDRLELSRLDALHKYKLISEEGYLAAVEALQDRVSQRGLTDARVELKKLELSTKFETPDDRVRHDTDVEILKAKIKLQENALAARQSSREISVWGDSYSAAKATAADKGKIEEAIAKVQEKLALSQQKAREAQENALRSPVDAARIVAAENVESVFLNEKYKIQTELAQLRDKDDAASLGRKAMLADELANLQVKQLIEKAIAENAAEDLVRRARSPEYGIRAALNAYVNDAENYGAQAEAAVTKNFKGMEDALVDFVTTGKDNFRSLGDSIISDMVRMQVQASITKPLAQIGQGLLSQWFGPQAEQLSGPGSGYTPPTLEALGAVHTSASLSALSGGIYNRPTYFQFANGGVLGEAGYEAVMPLTRGPNGKLGVQAGGVAPNVIINITNASGQPVAAKQSGPAQFDGENYIVGVVLSAVENNPRVRKALAGAMR